MFSLLNITPDNMIWFYLAPLLVFGPIFIAFLWNFGIKDLFNTPEGVKEHLRNERELAERIVKRREKKAGHYARTVHPATRPSPAWIGQAALYLIFAVVLAAFSAWPSYQYVAPEQAQVKLSLSHPGQRVDACRKRTKEELAALPPNMRGKMQCSRERWPIAVSLSIDGQQVFAGEAKAAGLRSDGASSFYEKFYIPAGAHNLKVQLNDGGPQNTDIIEFGQDVVLQPGQNLVIGYREGGGGFFLK